MKICSAFLGLLAVATTACSNPFPFGPGRVEIELEQASVMAVEHATLFPGSQRDVEAPERREALRLLISSATDLQTYFKDQDTQLQVRCAVDGNLNRKSYTGFALGPVPEKSSDRNGANAIPPSSYRYTIYAFIDLEADDVQYEGGKPASKLDLKTETFGSLKCHLLGVTKAPVLFPVLMTSLLRPAHSRLCYARRT